ncbi:MAG: hypothetical protein ACM3S5_07780 [Rhodospirillales bacterium]
MHRGLVLLIAAACTGAEHDPVDVLARMGRIVADNAARLPNYACVETVERRYYRAKLSRSPRNCDDLSGEKKKRGYKLILERTDRFRLEVRSGAVAELFSWPGDNRFEAQRPEQLVGYGPAASGSFGALLFSIFQSDATEFAFLGERESSGRKLFAYSFRIPEAMSHFVVHTLQGGSLPAGFEGTILADPETAEPVRLTTRTGELPSEAFCCEITSAFDYGRTRTGADSLLLPTEARQRFIERSGVETENITTFSDCREFRGESPPRNLGPPLAIRAGLPVMIALGARIDSATAAAGDRFVGTIAKPVEDAGQIVLPKGALVEGRITKVEVRTQPQAVTIDLAVETVEVGGAAVPFHVTGPPPDTRSKLEKVLSELRIGAGGLSTRPVARPPVPAPGEPRSSELHFPGERAILDRGFQTEWITVKP